jgi:squalene-hopene/tetraprenyl-beta-curcumene cyclase
LAQKLISTQKPDGSWINDNTRWLEGDPNLVTAYALLALSYSRP